MVDQGLIKFDPSDGRPPLQLPLTVARLCKTFSLLLMPGLYSAALLALAPRTRKRVELLWEPPDGYLEELWSRYPTRLYPILTLMLQSRVYAAEDDGSKWESLNVGTSSLGWSPPEGRLSDQLDPAALALPADSVDVYRLNNVVHQSDRRSPVMEEAARVLRPGGLLLLTDNTAGWLDSIWTIRLAEGLGRHALARRLANDKLASSRQNLVPGAAWWREHIDDRWEFVSATPFFSRDAMTVASLFESLNFKQGGPAPDWLTRRALKCSWLKRAYRRLIIALTRELLELDDLWTERSGSTSLLVVLRRTSL